MYTFNAPEAQGAVGFLVGRAVALTNLALDFPVDTAQFAAVTMQSQDDQPIAASDQLLMGVFTRVENTGMVWNADRTSLEDWGTAPTLIEPVRFTATLTLNDTDDVEVWALDETGALHHRVTHQVPTPGQIRFVVDTGTDKTLWYAVGRTTPTATPTPTATATPTRTPTPTLSHYQVYLPMVLRGWESAEPVMVSLKQDDAWVPLDTPIVLTIAWVADTLELMADYLAALDLTVILDGEPLPGVMNHWSEIEEYGDVDEDGDTDYESRWRYPVGVLSAGEHQVESEFRLQWPITDGFDLDDDGVPDEYSGVARGYFVQIVIGE